MTTDNDLTAEQYQAYLQTGQLPDDKKGKKRHKYHAQPQEYDGHKFASKAEMRRYIELKQMQHHGMIRNLVLQPRYPLRVKGVLVTTYVADFRYQDVEPGDTIVEDVKGFVTDVYRLKRKLMHVIHGIQIQEFRP